MLDIKQLSDVGINLKAGIIDGQLVIVVDPNYKGAPSKTGKMITTASTGGFASFPGGLKGNIFLGKKTGE